MRNLDLTSLRSFMAVVESGGVTRAAKAINKSQSAVSMQLKRLEDLLGVALHERRGRQNVLTESADQLLVDAKLMVALNDEVFARMTDHAFEGKIVLGVPSDIIYPIVPMVLKIFAAEFSGVQVQLISSYTSTLKEKFKKGEIDIILSTEAELDAGGETLKQTSLRWVGAHNGKAWCAEPLPYVSNRYCIFENSCLRALKTAGISFEVVSHADSDRAAEAMVAADIAVTTRLEGYHPSHLECIDSKGKLPDLGVQKINIYGPLQESDYAQRLMDILRKTVQDI